MTILAGNLRRLLERGQPLNLPRSQAELARRSGVSQKAISNWLDLTRDISPQLDKLEMIAGVYRCAVWELLIPQAADDILNRHLFKLVSNYQKIKNPAARTYVERIAEAEADYTASKTGKVPA